jgi:RimJ/RimL family protein N-acetyltransferase
MEDMWQGLKIRLRAPVPDDMHAYFTLPDSRNSASQRSGDRAHFPVGTEQLRKRMDEFSRMNPMGDEYFLIIETLDGQVAGSVNSHSAERFEGTFSYGIAVLPEHQGKGYASEAIRLLLRYYFNELGFYKCNAQAYSFNPESMRLHERFGFTLEGCLRSNHFAGGERWDVMCYGITREEFWEKYGK